MQPSDENMTEPSHAAPEGTKPTSRGPEKDERGQSFSLSSVSNVPALLTVFGIALYGLVNIGYSTFYHELGLNPDDVGLDYISILRRSTFLVLIALVIILAAFIYYTQRADRRLAEARARLEVERRSAIEAEYLAVLKKRLEDLRSQRDQLPPEEDYKQARLSMDIMELERDIRDIESESEESALHTLATKPSSMVEERLRANQQRSAAGRKLFFRVLGSTIVVLVAIFVLRSYCISKAEAVQNGEAVSPLAVLGLTVLAIEAIPAAAQPIGGASESPGLSGLAKKRLLYLGRSNGDLVLYESHRGALHVPASSVVLIMIE